MLIYNNSQAEAAYRARYTERAVIFDRAFLAFNLLLYSVYLIRHGYKTSTCLLVCVLRIALTVGQVVWLSRYPQQYCLHRDTVVVLSRLAGVGLGLVLYDEHFCRHDWEQPWDIWRFLLSNKWPAIAMVTLGMPLLAHQLLTANLVLALVVLVSNSRSCRIMFSPSKPLSWELATTAMTAVGHRLGFSPCNASVIADHWQRPLGHTDLAAVCVSFAGFRYRLQPHELCVLATSLVQIVLGYLMPCALATLLEWRDRRLTQTYPAGQLIVKWDEFLAAIALLISFLAVYVCLLP